MVCFFQNFNAGFVKDSIGSTVIGFLYSLQVSANNEESGKEDV